MSRGSGRRRAVLFLLSVAVSAQACGAIPRDTNNGLERATNGVLRIGVVEHRPWVIVDGDEIKGVEPQLLQRWASQLQSRIEWRRGHVENLVDALHRREIDVLAGGWYETTPYARRLAITQPYVQFDDEHGKSQALVLAVTPGESALLLNLDRFLATQDRQTILATASSLALRLRQ